MKRPLDAPVPAYGKGSLADLTPSVLASIGVPGFTDVLGLEPARAACVLLVDGMGHDILRAAATHAPTLEAVLAAGSGRTLTAGFPSTTAASLASIGTGLPPGAHGIVGYQTLVPELGRLMHSLRWDEAVLPERWQPEPTVFERALTAGAVVTRVSQRHFQGSGLTRAALRGGEYRAADTFGEVAATAVAALEAAPPRRPAFVYAYVSDLDATGHRRGVASRAWTLQLEHVDRLVTQLAEALPPEMVLYVTADHGMVDIAREARIDVDADPALRDGVALMGGEPRARHLYTTDGAAADVLSTWRERLAGRAWVRSRDEAVEAGWFGDVAPHVLPRIGDVVVAMSGDAAVVATSREPRESRLVGHHGSLTPAEQIVPLAVFTGP